MKGKEVARQSKSGRIPIKKQSYSFNSLKTIFFIIIPRSSSKFPEEQLFSFVYFSTSSIEIQNQIFIYKFLLNTKNQKKNTIKTRCSQKFRFLSTFRDIAAVLIDVVPLARTVFVVLLLATFSVIWSHRIIVISYPYNYRVTTRHHTHYIIIKLIYKAIARWRTEKCLFNGDIHLPPRAPMYLFRP